MSQTWAAMCFAIYVLWGLSGMFAGTVVTLVYWRCWKKLTLATKGYWWMNVVFTGLAWTWLIWALRPMLAGVFPPMHWIVFMILWSGAILALPAAASAVAEASVIKQQPA